MGIQTGIQPRVDEQVQLTVRRPNVHSRLDGYRGRITIDYTIPEGGITAKKAARIFRALNAYAFGEPFMHETTPIEMYALQPKTSGYDIVAAQQLRNLAPGDLLQITTASSGPLQRELADTIMSILENNQDRRFL